MLFQKSSPISDSQNTGENIAGKNFETQIDEVETVVGPSVNVEGDLTSAGNLIVKGTVNGSVYTTKHLTVENGAKIVANVRAGNAKIAGDIKGNVKIKETLELTSTSKIVGDITVKTLTVEPGALIYGKVTMPGVEISEKKSAKAVATRVFKKAVALGDSASETLKN